MRDHVTAGNRHLRLFEDKVNNEMCLPVNIGERAPINGMFTGHGSTQRVSVTVGDVAPSSGKFCIDAGNFALLQRSLGNAGLDKAGVERALSKKEDKNVESSTSGKAGGNVEGSTNGKDGSSEPEPVQYPGYEVIGDGACATSDQSSRSSGEYTCLDGAHEGCAGGEDPTEDADGFLLCAGPDGEINTDDDTYLECAETDHTQDDCIAACTAKSGCNGVEYKVASHTKKSVCELHYTTIDGWKDSVWFNRKSDGSFAPKPDGQGFRKGLDDPDANAEISLPVADLQACQDECAKHPTCKGIEFEQPQVMDQPGDCEVQFLDFSHYVKGSCYKKKQ